MTVRIADPYIISDFRQLALKLRTGHWIVFPWERSGLAHDHATWCDDLAEACNDIDIDVFFDDHPKKSLTVILNTAALPRLEQLTASIARIEHDRFMERELGSEIHVKTGEPARWENYSLFQPGQ